MDKVAASPFLQAAVDGFDGLMVVTVRNVLSGAIIVSYMYIWPLFFLSPRDGGYIRTDYDIGKRTLGHDEVRGIKVANHHLHCWIPCGDQRALFSAARHNGDL